MSQIELDESQQDRGTAALWAVVSFFFLMVGYYILRPVREMFGVERGPEVLKYLYLGTFLGVLITAPLYSALVSRTSRKKFIPFVFRFFSLNLVLFSFAIGASDDNPWPGRIFYCWLSVYNVFAVSVIWSYLVDLFKESDAKKLFGPIAVGMSAGAIVGSLITDQGIQHLGLATLLLIPVAVGEIVLFGLRRVESSATIACEDASSESVDKPIEGTIYDGIVAVAKSPYLRYISLLLFCLAAAEAVFYFAQNIYVREYFGSDRTAKTQFFSRMNIAKQCVTFLCQGLVVTWLVKRWGMKVALSIVPFIGFLGLLALGIQGGIAVLVPVYVLMKGTKLGISSPTKHMLYSVVSREEKYKSKNFIDTVVVRGSDVVIIWILAFLQDSLQWGVKTIVLSTVPLAFIWILAALRIGKLHAQETEIRPAEV